MLLNGQLHFLPVPFPVGQRHAPRAHGGEEGVFFNFHPPAGAVRQVQVKPVELEEGHGVNHALDLRHGEEVAGDVQHDAPPFKTGNVPDGEDGHGEAFPGPVGVQDLDHALPRVEEALGVSRIQMQYAPPSLHAFQTRLISFSRSRRGPSQGAHHVRRIPVPRHGKPGQDALCVEHIQEGFHCRNILFRGINGQSQRQEDQERSVRPALGGSRQQHVFRRDGMAFFHPQEGGHGQHSRPQVKPPSIHHSRNTGTPRTFFHIKPEGVRRTTRAPVLPAPITKKGAAMFSRASGSNPFPPICGRQRDRPGLLQAPQGLSGRQDRRPCREGRASCRPSPSWRPSVSSWRPSCPCRTSSCAFRKSS